MAKKRPEDGREEKSVVLDELKMTKTSVSELIKELEVLIDKISKEPPAEINNLNNVSSIPGMHRYGRISIAYSKLREFTYTLGCLHNSAKQGVAIESIVSITISIIENQLIFTDCFGLTDTSQLLRKVCTVLRDVQSADEYGKIAIRLKVYIAKLAQTGWIDTLLIHAADMELMYDLMFPPNEKT